LVKKRTPDENIEFIQAGRQAQMALGYARVVIAEQQKKIVDKMLSGQRGGTLTDQDLRSYAGGLLSLDDFIRALETEIAKGFRAQEEEIGDGRKNSG
jgi:hypothetical protein